MRYLKKRIHMRSHEYTWLLVEEYCIQNLLIEKVNKSKIKLIRALFERNKLAKNIKDIQNKTSAHNSYIVGNSPDYKMSDQLDNKVQMI